MCACGRVDEEGQGAPDEGAAVARRVPVLRQVQHLPYEESCALPDSQGLPHIGRAASPVETAWTFLIWVAHHRDLPVARAAVLVGVRRREVERRVPVTDRRAMPMHIDPA